MINIPTRYNRNKLAQWFSDASSMSLSWVDRSVSSVVCRFLQSEEPYLDESVMNIGHGLTNRHTDKNCSWTDKQINTLTLSLHDLSRIIFSAVQANISCLPWHSFSWPFFARFCSYSSFCNISCHITSIVYCQNKVEILYRLDRKVIHRRECIKKTEPPFLRKDKILINIIRTKRLSVANFEFYKVIVIDSENMVVQIFALCLTETFYEI